MEEGVVKEIAGARKWKKEESFRGLCGSHWSRDRHITSLSCSFTSSPKVRKQTWGF